MLASDPSRRGTLRPANPRFDGLAIWQIERIVKTAIDAQWLMGAGDELAAMELIPQYPNDTWSVEMIVALWSCFSSSQRSAIKELWK